MPISGNKEVLHIFCVLKSRVKADRDAAEFVAHRQYTFMTA